MQPRRHFREHWQRESILISVAPLRTAERACRRIQAPAVQGTVAEAHQQVVVCTALKAGEQHAAGDDLLRTQRDSGDGRKARQAQQRHLHGPAAHSRKAGRLDGAAWRRETGAQGADGRSTSERQGCLGTRTTKSRRGRASSERLCARHCRVLWSLAPSPSSPISLATHTYGGNIHAGHLCCECGGASSCKATMLHLKQRELSAASGQQHLAWTGGRQVDGASPRR
jgi:hypothetical protein